MSEVIEKRLKENVGKNIKIFLKNGFKFEGKVTNCDNNYVEIFDTIIQGYKIINISEINNIEVKG